MYVTIQVFYAGSLVGRDPTLGSYDKAVALESGQEPWAGGRAAQSGLQGQPPTGLT